MIMCGWLSARPDRKSNIYLLENNLLWKKIEEKLHKSVKVKWIGLEKKSQNTTDQQVTGNQIF